MKIKIVEVTRFGPEGPWQKYYVPPTTPTAL